MEKIKDFFYEKSDIFFASIVVVLVTTVVLYNLNGWLVIDGEASRYHEIPVSSEDGKKPSDNALVANPEEDKKDKKESEKSESEKKTDKKEDTDKSKGESKTEQNKKDAEKTKPEKTEADKKAQEQKKSEQKPQEKKTEQKKPEQEKQEKKATNRTITIASGSSAKSIANSLKNQGIISDTNAFLNQLASSGKETKLKAGTFTIPEGSSPDQIISILTR